jgi:hypothetical protein
MDNLLSLHDLVMDTWIQTTWEKFLGAIEAALQQNQTLDDTEINRWLMQQFQSL